MPKDILRKVAGYLAQGRRRRMWKKIVSVFACVVVFCTTYALILPALTLEKEPQCGKTEHTHSEACYIQETTKHKVGMVCTPESLGLHQHTDACLDENGNYCCSYSDFVVHQHDNSCYDENGNLWCTLPEVGTHTHDENCYAKPEPEYIQFEPDPVDAGIQPVKPVTETMDAGVKPAETGIEPAQAKIASAQTGTESVETGTESAETETESAETGTKPAEVRAGVAQQGMEPVQTELICGRTEIILHTHDSACFDGNGNLVCGQTQVQEHVHGGECFETVEEPTGEKTLRCVFEEHTHGEECFTKQDENDVADQSADLETADIWEATLPETISEKWQKAVLAVAESQIGYEESKQNYIADEQGRKKGYTRYGEWYGDSYGDWCAMFVSFCLHYADIPEEAFPQEASCPRWIENLQKEEYDLYRETENYKPKAGDVIFFDWNKDKTADHVGLVAEIVEATETEPAMLRTIEGNSKDCVRYAEYELNDGEILGYGELPEEPRICTKRREA